MSKQEEKEKIPMSYRRQPVRPDDKGAHGVAELAAQSALPQIIMVIQLYSWHTVNQSDLWQRYIAPLFVRTTYSRDVTTNPTNTIRNMNVYYFFL